MSKVESVVQLFERTGDGETMWDQVGHSQMFGKPEGFDRGGEWQGYMKRTLAVE